MTEPTTSSPVHLFVDEETAVATVTLSRPEGMNALDVATKDALLETLRQVAEDTAVRCVVLTGTGRAFCVGQDLKEHITLLQDDPEAISSTVAEHYNPIAELLLTMDKPVIAAVNGVAAGAGASFAMAADLRYVARSAGFNLAFTGVALSCDSGASWTLPRLVGRAKALELLYLPRTVGAEEAMDLGLVTEIVEDDQLADRVAEVAARLAAGPTLAYGSVRRSVAFSATHPLPESLYFEEQMMQRTGTSEDHVAAVQAFVAKEQPRYRGR